MQTALRREQNVTDSGGYKDGSFAESEVLERLLALMLRTVAVNRLSRITFLIEELLQLLSTLLRLHKHQRQ